MALAEIKLSTNFPIDDDLLDHDLYQRQKHFNANLWIFGGMEKICPVDSSSQATISFLQPIAFDEIDRMNVPSGYNLEELEDFSPHHYPMQTKKFEVIVKRVGKVQTILNFLEED